MPKSVTLNILMTVILRYVTELAALMTNFVKVVVEVRPILTAS